MRLSDWPAFGQCEAVKSVPCTTSGVFERLVRDSAELRGCSATTQTRRRHTANAKLRRCIGRSVRQTVPSGRRCVHQWVPRLRVKPIVCRFDVLFWVMASVTSAGVAWRPETVPCLRCHRNTTVGTEVRAAPWPFGRNFLRIWRIDHRIGYVSHFHKHSRCVDKFCLQFCRCDSAAADGALKWLFLFVI